MSATADVRTPPPAGQPPKAAPPLPPTRRAADREFLPAALEILETPPSPVRMWLLLTICALVVGAVTWAYFGRIDIIAVAQGKIQSTGRVKLVQSIETGKVRTLLVDDGAHVEAGDAVVELDNSEARAEERALTEALASYRAEVLRRAAAIVGARDRSYVAPAVNWPADVPKNVQAREQRVLDADLAQLQSATKSLAGQKIQKQAERQRLTETIDAQQKLIGIEDQRVQMRAALEKEKLGSRLNLLDAQETMQYQHTSLAQQQGQLAEAIAAIDVFDRDTTKAVDAFIAENGQKLADAERQVDDTAQKLAKAKVKTSHMLLRAPVSGSVQALSITSVGQVVMPGEEVMRIVPDDTGFEIECYMPNKDIGFVTAGQEAVVKIESFPFTRYGSLSARVTRVGKDAIPEPDAQQEESNPGKAPKSTLIGGAQRTQNLVFPVTLTPDQASMTDHGTPLPISNGMAVSVEIKTGDRRIIDYLFSPLVEIGSRAMKER